MEQAATRSCGGPRAYFELYNAQFNAATRSLFELTGAITRPVVLNHPRSVIDGHALVHQPSSIVRCCTCGAK